MGAVTKQEIEDFAFAVLYREFPDYKMKWTRGGGICIRKSKIIYIDKRFIGKYPWVAKEHILHECAHIKTVDDMVHGEDFYKEYIRLLKLFMI